MDFEANQLPAAVCRASRDRWLSTSAVGVDVGARNLHAGDGAPGTS
jgi:hypothetical protein